MLQPIWPVLAAGVVLLAATLVWARGRWSSGARPETAARILLALVAIGIGLHPVGATEVGAPRRTTVDLVLVVDRTTSMGAQDYAGARPRMEGVAADLTSLVAAASGARVAVVVFDDDARLAVPFTTDANSVATYLQTVGWRPTAKASGSDISVAAPLTEQVLRQAAADRPDHDRYVVYAGDGEQTAETPPAGFAAAQALVTDALVLGYGTAEGGPMTVSDDSDELVRIDGVVQTSRSDEAALGSIAEQLGGTYAHRTAPGDLPELVPPGAPSAETETVPGEEYAWVLGLLAGAALLVLIWTAVRRLRDVREEVAGAPR
jgi:Ca-activated chloride channel homolog